MGPKQPSAAAARKPSSPAAAKRQDGSKPNFYDGPTEFAAKKIKPRDSGSTLTASSVKAKSSLSPSKPRSPLRTLLLRLAVSFTLLSLLFCPPQVTPSTPAICRPASQYHQTLQPYIQPHINSVISSSKAHLGPYYEPYRPQVEAVGARLGSLGASAVEATEPYVALGRSTVVRNYKQHVAPRMHYARLRLTALARPYLQDLAVRYQVLIRPYVVLAHNFIARHATALAAHPRTAAIQAKVAQLGQLVQSGAQSAHRRVQPEIVRLSAVAFRHAATAVEQGKRYGAVAATRASRVVRQTVLPFACKSYRSGKDLGFSGGQKAALEARRIVRDIIQPQLARSVSTFQEKVYAPYLAEHLEPLVQPAKLIVKTSVHQAFQFGRPVVRYSKLALELTVRYTMLVYNQVVSPAVSRTAASFNSQVYVPYLANHLDPVIGPIQASLAGAVVQGQKVSTPILGQARRLALPVWRTFFPESKEPTLIEKAQGSIETATDKIGTLLVAKEEPEQEPTLVEQVQEAYEAAVEKVGFAFESQAADVTSEEAAVEGVATLESQEPSEVEALGEGDLEEVQIAVADVAEPVPIPAPVVPGVLAAEADIETQSDAADEVLRDDEDAEFLASLEGSEDPVEIPVPEIHVPELPDLPDVDDTAAEVAEKDNLKKVAVREMRQEIEKKQRDFEEKMRRVGELEEQKLIAELVDIRARAVSSFPRLAEHWLSTVEKDANKAAKSLEKYFKRSNLKWDDVESAVLKGRSRIDGKVDDAAEGVNEWLAEIEGREEQAVTKACDNVDAVAAEAVNALGLAYAWLDDVTRHDWARYHGISKSGADWHDTFAEHAATDKSSADLDTPATDVDGLIEAFREELDQVQDGFSARIGILKTNAMLKLDREDRKARGLPEAEAGAPMVSIQPIWDAIGGGAAVGAGVIGKGKGQVLDALSQASEAAVGTVESAAEAGRVAHASSQAAAFVEAASEVIIGTTVEANFVEQATHAVEEATSQVASLADDASSILHSVTRAAASAVGVTPSPEAPTAHVESLFAAISEGASSVVEAASETLHEATRAASRAVGATPSPETIGETLEQTVEDVKSLADGSYERVQEALHVADEL